MVFWGGLRPIAAQVVVDVFGLVGFGYVTFSKATSRNSFILHLVAALTIILSGNLTNRWTVIFPMIPLLALQGLRRLNPDKNLVSRLLGFFSILLILLAGLLSLLFPAVELPPLESPTPYNVGVVDVFLPVNFQYSTNIPDAQHVCPAEQDHVTVRILYPTKDDPGTIPYLKPETSEVFCEETMKYGAPPPLQKFGWMLHYWRLVQLSARQYAQPLEMPSPLIMFSPGLGGNAEMYSYQTRSLAAHGYVVVVVDHSDGSAPVILRKDGSLLRRNETVLQDWIDGRKEKYKRSRRAMTEYRAEEVLHAVDTMVQLNTENIRELESFGLSFVGKLDTDEIHFMGHSFGGATSLHAARQRLPASIIAHEPASDWIPDATRGSLFDWDRVQGSSTNYQKWSTNVTDGWNTSVHDTELLVMFSQEWETKQWGGVDVLKDVFARGLMGPKGGTSKVLVVPGAFHNEFSDTCMLTPTWLARATNITGPRSPLETAKEIHETTLDFLKTLKPRYPK